MRTSNILLALLLVASTAGLASADTITDPPALSGPGISSISPGVYSWQTSVAQLYLVWNGSDWDVTATAPALASTTQTGPTVVLDEHLPDQDPTRVPEPATLLLLSTGLAGVGLVSRRRKA